MHKPINRKTQTKKGKKMRTYYYYIQMIYQYGYNFIFISSLNNKVYLLEHQS